MRNSEKIMIKLLEIQNNANVGLFEAAALFCEDMDIDPGDFKSMLDDTTLERLKLDAIECNKVQKRFGKKTKSLFE